MNGKKVPTAPLSSLARAREIAQTLKKWIQDGAFLLTEPVALLPGPQSEYGIRPLVERPIEKEKGLEEKAAFGSRAQEESR